MHNPDKPNFVLSRRAVALGLPLSFAAACVDRGPPSGHDREAASRGAAAPHASGRARPLQRPSPMAGYEVPEVDLEEIEPQFLRRDRPA